MGRYDRWMNGIWTHGILMSKCDGATWPSPGLPCGTPPLVRGMEKVYGFNRN
jgi:hypothetical protein